MGIGYVEMDLLERFGLMGQLATACREFIGGQNEGYDIGVNLQAQLARIVGRHSDVNPVEQISDVAAAPGREEIFACQGGNPLAPS